MWDVILKLVKFLLSSNNPFVKYYALTYLILVTIFTRSFNLYCRLINFLGLNEDSEKERRAALLGKKKKVVHETKLLVNETMETCTFLILAGVNMLLLLTLPIKILEEPCELFMNNVSDKGMDFYSFTVTVKEYASLIDGIIILMFVALVIVGAKTVLDGIALTKINISPWLEQGKYVLPGTKCCDHNVRDPDKDRAEARARAKRNDEIMEKLYKQYEESNGRFYDREFYKMYYGNCEIYDQMFTQSPGQKNDQKIDQKKDQINKKKFDLNHETTHDQTVNWAHHKNYDQSYLDQIFDPKFDLIYQDCDETPVHNSDKSSNESSEISSDECSETDLDN